MKVYGKNVFNELDLKKVRKVYLSKNFNDKDIINIIKINKLKYVNVDQKVLDGMFAHNQGIVVEINDYDYKSMKDINFEEKMINDNFLTSDEIDVFKRGRNASSHSSRSTDIVTYKKSTGLESLIGYLYLNKDNMRIKEIMEYIVGVE